MTLLLSNPDTGVPSNRPRVLRLRPLIASSDCDSDCCANRKQEDTSIIWLWSSYKHDPRGTLVGEENFFPVGGDIMNISYDLIIILQ